MLWESHNPLESLPPLPVESRRLIAAFLDANHDVFELACHLEQDVFDLVQQLSVPVVKSWIAAMTAMENSARRERALRTLDAALTNSADNATLRRCASRLLRHFEITRPRAPKSCSQNMQPDRQAAADIDLPSPPTTPDHTSNPVLDPKDQTTIAKAERSEPLESATALRQIPNDQVHPPNIPPQLASTNHEIPARPTPDLSESSCQGPGEPSRNVLQHLKESHPQLATRMLPDTQFEIPEPMNSSLLRKNNLLIIENAQRSPIYCPAAEGCSGRMPAPGRCT